LLEIKGDVDFGTGNIDFHGDVLLHGRVAGDFTIACTGTLRSMQTLDVYGVQCGALECRQGVIGHRDAVLSADGPVQARFLQNVTVQAADTVAVATSMLAARITTAGTIRLGRNSTVIGSILRASDGVEAYNIGSPGSAATEIYLGIDFDIDHRLADIRDYSMALGKRLRDVRLRLRHTDNGDGRKELQNLEQELRNTITRLGQQASDLVHGLDRNENAELVVRGTVYTGTYIEICHRSFHVDRPMKNCRIYLNRKKGLVEAEPLNAQHAGRNR
jgi:uncharacterized protein